MLNFDFFLVVFFCFVPLHSFHICSDAKYVRTSVFLSKTFFYNKNEKNTHTHVHNLTTTTKNGIQSVLRVWKENDDYDICKEFMHVFSFIYVRVYVYFNTHKEHSQWSENEWILSKRNKKIGTNIRWRKEHDVILMSIIDPFFFNTSNIALFAAFFSYCSHSQVFLVLFGMCSVCARAMLIHLYSIAFTLNHTSSFFLLNIH